MPNHFHLLIQESKEGGVSAYIQRIEIAYTKYFNTKYKRSGYLFQGPFRSVHVNSNRQLLYLSAYIHRNPREMKKWQDKEHIYPWSSYQDIVKENRWGELLKYQAITEQFASPEEYKEFVKTSKAKELKSEFLIDIDN